MKPLLYMQPSHPHGAVSAQAVLFSEGTPTSTGPITHRRRDTGPINAISGSLAVAAVGARHPVALLVEHDNLTLHGRQPGCREEGVRGVGRGRTQRMARTGDGAWRGKGKALLSLSTPDGRWAAQMGPHLGLIPPSFQVVIGLDHQDVGLLVGRG